MCQFHIITSHMYHAPSMNHSLLPLIISNLFSNKRYILIPLRIQWYYCFVVSSHRWHYEQKSACDYHMTVIWSVLLMSSYILHCDESQKNISAKSHDSSDIKTYYWEFFISPKVLFFSHLWARHKKQLPRWFYNENCKRRPL